MQTKRIICPKCKVVLDVKNSLNETVKQITCPSCKSILQVRFQPQEKPIEANTYYAPSQQSAKNNGETQLASSEGETQLGSSVSGATQLYAPSKKDDVIALLIFEGKEYPLEEGQNIIGRKGTTSKATIQIETADRYMSRQHCRITVTTQADGAKKVVLGNYQNKNLTSIDGHPIETGDSIRLTDGNSITMGHTTVTFKLT